MTLVAMGIFAVCALYVIALLVLVVIVVIALMFASSVVDPENSVHPDGADPADARFADLTAARTPDRVVAAIVQAAARDMAVYDGVIDEVDGGHLVLTVGEEDMLFRIEAGASVTLDGKPASVANLKPGYWASVTAIELEDKILIATDIQAESDVSGIADGQ